jgi:sulfhydrogenase subunit beta (sulfur reductase)
VSTAADRTGGRPQVRLATDQIEKLIQALRSRGYKTFGPTVRDGAVVYDEVEQARDLPQGQTDEQGAGSYRLKPRADGALFGYAVGPQSWKRHLHPANVKLFEAEQKDGLFRILTDAPVHNSRSAFLGVRACDLAAIGVQDRVLLNGPYRDPIYQSRRDQVSSWLCNVHRQPPPASARRWEQGHRFRRQVLI